MPAHLLAGTRDLNMVVVLTSFIHQLVKSRIPACHGKLMTKTLPSQSNAQAHRSSPGTINTHKKREHE